MAERREVNIGPCGGRLESLPWVRHDGRATRSCER